MKKLYPLLSVLPLLLIVGCSKPINESSLIDRNGVKYQKDSQKPYSGEVFRLYDTGEKLYQGTYVDGLLTQDTYLNKDGSVKEPIEGLDSFDLRDEVCYIKGTNKPYSGRIFSLHENGQKSDEGTLIDGELDGLRTEWYENGQKKEEVTFKDGELDGLGTLWYENGQKKEEATFKDGNLILSKEWYEDGSVVE